MGHDVYRSFGESPEKTAEAIRAKALVIVSLQDRMVNPEPARAFAGSIRARLVELNSNCGHAAFMCDGDKLREPVAEFLSE